MIEIISAALTLFAGGCAAIAARTFTGTDRIPILPVIAAAAVIGAWSVLTMPPTFLLPVTIALGIALLLLAIVDARSLRLPDLVTFPLIACGLVLSLFLPGETVLDHCIGAAGGYYALALLRWLFRQNRGYEGLGLGDAKLAAAAGAWLGWLALPSVLLIACAGGFFWIAVRAAAKGRGTVAAEIPFGVPLCLAFWLVWLYGPPDLLSAL